MPKILDSDNNNQLHCFSPPVMLVTMIIEFGSAAYVTWRYKLTRRARLTIAGLVCLGVFQLAEFLICESLEIPGLTWARIGHVAISCLPPLGISLAMELAGKRSQKAKMGEYGLYAACLAFVIYYGFVSGAITAETCGGNYVIFQGGHPYAGPLYGIYYLGLLAVGTYFSWQWAKSADHDTRVALYGLMIGYLTFIIPTTVVYLLDRSVTGGIPSIMCGFAVFLAVMIIGVTVPHGGYQKRLT